LHESEVHKSLTSFVRLITKKNPNKIHVRVDHPLDRATNKLTKVVHSRICSAVVVIFPPNSHIWVFTRAPSRVWSASPPPTGAVSFLHPPN